ncbi:HAD-IIIA family hydrolase [Pleurocapsales cyanobacterium LEGE 06147]|nr:HAD-IIIA family hydrolase [Pleurocapsales cyanobacterium LEGE 06147]
MAKSAIFLDCNDVLNIKADYLHKIEDLRLLPEVATAIRKLNDLNLFCCLVSNQSGPAQNYYPLSHVDALHERLCQLLYSQAQAKLDAFYYCPYLSPTAGGTNPEFTGWSTWRKPNTGMLVAAAWEYNLNLQQSFVIGDKSADIDLAHNVGAKGILVQTERSKKVSVNTLRFPRGNLIPAPSALKNKRHLTRPDYIAHNLIEAVGWICDVLNLSKSHSQF